MAFSTLEKNILTKLPWFRLGPEEILAEFFFCSGPTDRNAWSITFEIFFSASETTDRADYLNEV